jgi:hypothetical protein
MDTKRILPLRVAARALGVKPDDLKADADAGLVPFTKVGSAYVFELCALERAITSRAEQDAEPGKGAAR